MQNIPVVANISTERHEIRVTAGPLSAGQPLEFGGQSVAVRFRLALGSADIEFRNGSGVWTLVPAAGNSWVESPIDLSETPVAVRKSQRGKGAVVAMVEIDRFVRISPTEIGSETGVQGPKGEAGPQGEQGIQGERGETGLQGETGPSGPTGAAGAKGDPGTTGPVGPAGADGPKGDAGPQGPKGDVGPKGDAGVKGDTGSKGDTGAAGPKGETGPQGVKGDTGAKGDQGAQGIQGIQGVQGAAGVNAFGTPTTRTITKGTAYRATTPEKPSSVTVVLTSDAALTLSGGASPEADIVIGPTNAVASGTGTVIGKYKNGIAGALVVGINITNTQTTPYTFTLPAGWFFAIVQKVATVNIVSCYDQSVG